jgi:uncharacterized protein YbjQ (UPF0145 family)
VQKCFRLPFFKYEKQNYFWKKIIIMKHRLITAIILSAFLTGCSTSAYLGTNDTGATPKSSVTASKIEVYCVPDINKNYSLLGEVMACKDAGEDATKTVELLKIQAAQLGADAIIDLRLEFVQGGWSVGIKATGKAVKFN